MKIATLSGVCGRARIGRCGRVAVFAALLLAAANLFAATTATTVDRVAGLGSAGYVNGLTLEQAKFSTPCGLAASTTGRYLYVADRDNNAIRQLDLLSDLTITIATNLVSKPVGVALDGFGNLYVLNRGNGKNGSVLEFDGGNLESGGGCTLLFTNAINLTNAAGMALDVAGNIYVTINSNTVLRITSPGVSNVVATIPYPDASLQGLVFKRSGPSAGLLAVCDARRNGIYLINPTSGAVTTNAGFHGAGDFTQSPSASDSSSASTAKFNQPMGIAEAGDGSLIVADNANHRVKVVRVIDGTVTNLYGVVSNDWAGVYPGFSCHATAHDANGPVTGNGFVEIPDVPGGVSARMPNGMAIGPDGTVYTTEDYYQIIRKVTSANILPPPPFPPSTPTSLTATAGYGQISLTWNSSIGATNYNIKRSKTSGGEITIASTGGTSTSFTDTNLLDGTNYFYVVSALNTGGESPNSAEASAAALFSPPPTSLIVTATSFGQISLAWSPSAGATSYNVKRSQSPTNFTTIASTASTSYNDNSVVNGNTYYYVVTAVNAGGENPTNSPVASGTPPLPAVPDPRIGWITFPPPLFSSVFNVGSQAGVTFNNDVFIVIVGDGVSQLFYTYSNTPVVANLPDPTSSDHSAQNGFVNGDDPTSFTVAQILPDLSIKAIGMQANHANSGVVSALFQFVVGNPTVFGNNAAQFTVTNITAGAQMYYTTDGTDPTTNSTGPVLSGQTLSLNFGGSTNLLLKIRGFKANYHPSGIVSNLFTIDNFQPNAISFGFASGEASSDFVASPGQVFIAPVTLTILPNTLMYSLQFNLTVTNAGPNPGPPIFPNAFIFNSFLMKPDPDLGPNLFVSIPPYMFINNAVGGVPPSQIVSYEGTNFVNLETVNTALNLMGVGWLERAGQTNLYNTLSQDLIQYSLAHDTVFLQGSGQIIVGAYEFLVPPNATPGQTYQIQIGRPSATSDGIGRPGFSVFIAAPTNGSLAGGSINAIKNVTVGQRKYIAGDSAPFRWFNAGDFGNTNLDNSDEEQVFQSAIYSLNYPPAGSDFFDSMDSCGQTYVDNGFGYLQPSGIPANTSLLFNGNDTTINQIAFGNGVLDACDVYVTYRRALDPTLTWFRRFLTNDIGHGYIGIAAETTSNVFVFGAAKQSPGAKAVPATGSDLPSISVTNTPSVNFVAGDFQTTAGQSIQIPITASDVGPYPLRVAMLNISVVPLDGSPALTTPISFSPGTLGTPTPGFTASQGAGNFAAAWLDSTIAGISNNATIGTLNVTIPANAASSSAYAVHFDHASGSPNGLASFPKHTQTGVITLSSRNTSTYNDGIPDSWRLRWFGTTNNLLSVSNACPSGDGINNWKKYVAGVDPNTPGDFPGLKPNTPPPLGAAMSIYWPTVSGKHYAILSSASLFPGNWTTNATITGNGANMEFDDHSIGTGKFYRVLILP